VIEKIDILADSIQQTKRSESLGHRIPIFWTLILIFLLFLQLGKRQVMCPTIRPSRLTHSI
jgi:hypothetical protein